MAKRDQMGGSGLSKRYQQPAQVPQQTPAVVASAQPTESQQPAKLEHIEEFRRCPICWERCKGVGCVYSTQGQTRYYKCKRTQTEHPPCGHTWTARVEVVRVEHRSVVLNER